MRLMRAHLGLGLGIRALGVAAGVVIVLPLHAQEPPASPLLGSRPVQEMVISNLIIEQADFSDAACGEEQRRSRIPVSKLKIERLAAPGANDADVALPDDLRNLLLDQGNKFLLGQASSALAPVYSLCDLRVMASALTQLHQRRTGQALSRVVIPAQDITAGELELKVLEGRVEAYSVRRVQNNAEGRPELIVAEDERHRETIEALQVLLDPYLHNPLRSRDLERAMLLVGA